MQFSKNSANYVFHAVTLFIFSYQCSKCKKIIRIDLLLIYIFRNQFGIRVLWKSFQCITLKGCCFPDINYEVHYKTAVCQELSRITLLCGLPGISHNRFTTFSGVQHHNRWICTSAHTVCWSSVASEEFCGLSKLFTIIVQSWRRLLPNVFLHVPSCLLPSLSLLSCPLLWVVVCCSCVVWMLCVVVLLTCRCLPLSLWFWLWCVRRMRCVLLHAESLR